jgi:outer membrane protein assembly factor BamB
MKDSTGLRFTLGKHLAFTIASAIGLAWAVPFALPGADAGENWAGWRGPTGMGITDEKALPLTWGGPKKINVLWKVPLFPSDRIRPDQNQSSPIVWGERVFVTVSYWPESVPTKSYPEHHLLCFHKEDGRRLWDRKIPPGPWLLTDLRGGYTAPTPACDGQRVYVLFGSAVLAAVDMDGKLLWRKEITPHDFDVAIGTSPVVHGDTVLVLCDLLLGKKASRLLAFDGKTGALKWENKRPDADWAHSTPVLAKIKGQTQLLVGSANGLQGLDPDGGKILWRVQTGDRTGDTVSPVLGSGLVYCDSGRGGPGIAVDPTGDGDVSRTHLKWKINSIPDGFSSPVIVGDYLYRLHNPGVIACWKLSDGTLVARKRLDGLATSPSPFTTPDGRLYCASSGKSYVLRAGPQLELLAQNDLGDPSQASPAVAAGRIYFKGNRFLFCVGK